MPVEPAASGAGTNSSSVGDQRPAAPAPTPPGLGRRLALRDRVRVVAGQDEGDQAVERVAGQVRRSARPPGRASRDGPGRREAPPARPTGSSRRSPLGTRALKACPDPHESLPRPAQPGQRTTGTTSSATASTVSPGSTSSPPAHDPERARAHVRLGLDRQALDRVPAEALDLERVHLHGDRRELAGRVVVVDRLDDRLEVLGLGRAHRDGGLAEHLRVVLDRLRQAVAQLDLAAPSRAGRARA